MVKAKESKIIYIPTKPYPVATEMVESCQIRDIVLHTFIARSDLTSEILSILATGQTGLTLYAVVRVFYSYHKMSFCTFASIVSFTYKQLETVLPKRLR